MYRKVILILFLIVLSLQFYLSPPSTATSTARLSVEPAVLTGLEIGDSFTIDVVVTNVTDLYGWQFVLYYKSSVLNATNLSVSSTWSPPNAFIYVINFTDNYNATHGQIFVASTMLGAVNGITGTTTLATVSFKTITYGNSPLYIDPIGNPPEYADRVKLIDSTKPFGKEISCEVYQGRAHVGLVDIAILKIAAPLNVPKNSLALINVTVENQGIVTETFDIALHYDAIAIGTQTVTNLAPTESRTFTFPWDTTPIPIGEYKLTATATELSGEVDLEDNRYTTPIYVGKRDIAIINTSPSKTYTNDTIVSINVSVANKGEAIARFNLTVYLGTIPIGTVTDLALAPGASVWTIFTVDTSSPDIIKGVYPINSTASPVPGETNTADNTYSDVTITETIRGDVTGDFRVDLKDIYQFARAFGTREGHPMWNANCDLNNDGQVNLSDVFYAARNYGQQI